MRIEKDAIGTVEIPSDKYYGIHTARSLSNFPDSGEKVNPYFIKAFLQVKLAAADTNFEIGMMEKYKHTAISEAVNKLLKETENAINKVEFGIYNKIVVDSLQGGAGTSLNMNINEVIANTA
ncbi:MAG: lyase family protein, partial [Melioribacteraceae bacterium]|nr:lyase family protein [Melioribacteraceae bacterium]